MKIHVEKMKWTAAVFICLGIVACAGGSSAPTQFYMIDPVTPTSEGKTRLMGRPAVLISLGPVEIPEYLNRPQIVTHLNGTAYHLDEFHQWLEPLGETLTRVIAENLSEMLDDQRIDVLSMARSIETDYSVNIQILRFDGAPGKEMVLIARWSLFGETEKVLSMTERVVIKEKMIDDSLDRLVKTQNRMIEALSRKIADAIRPIVQSGGS
jgi:uncharacterized protein